MSDLTGSCNKQNIALYAPQVDPRDTGPPVANAASLARVAAEVQAVEDTLVGRAVGADQPLMEAGLDSLGEQGFAGRVPVPPAALALKS